MTGAHDVAFRLKGSAASHFVDFRLHLVGSTLLRGVDAPGAQWGLRCGPGCCRQAFRMSSRFVPCSQSLPRRTVIALAVKSGARWCFFLSDSLSFSNLLLRGMTGDHQLLVRDALHEEF